MHDSFIHRCCCLLTTISLAGLFVSAACSHPHYLAYFNELSGGSDNGASHLLGSNVDWGQALLEVRDWAIANPDARPLFLAVNCPYDARALGFPVAITVATDGAIHADRNSPEALESLASTHGWFVISRTYLSLPVSREVSKDNPRVIRFVDLHKFAREHRRKSFGHAVDAYFVELKSVVSAPPLRQST